MMFASYSLAAVEQTATIESLKGSAQAQLAEQAIRQLETESPLYVGDKITTFDNTTIVLRFNDDTKFFIGENAEMVIDEFLFKAPEQENKFSTRVLKGTFRFVSGLIAKEKPEAMEVNTTVATIGIRGTQVIGEVDTTSAIIILLEPEDTSRKPVIDVYNQFGQVTIDEPGYGTEIPDEFSPPSPPRRMRLQTINNLMRSIQSIQRIRVPRPRTR